MIQGKGGGEGVITIPAGPFKVVFVPDMEKLGAMSPLASIGNQCCLINFEIITNK